KFSVGHECVVQEGDGKRDAVGRAGITAAASSSTRNRASGIGDDGCVALAWGFGRYPTRVTLTFVPALTFASAFTLPTALAKMLHGLASRVSSPRLIGVRPKPSAIAWPSGQ